MGAFLAFVVLIVLGIGDAAAAKSSGFKLCRSTYALCTTAACTPVAGEKDAVSCACKVKTGYSAGQEACQPVRDTIKGKQVRSRYYPVKSYAVCANDRPWAWCLDKPCIIDKNNPTKAKCACTSVNNQGPYVIVTADFTPSTCTTGVISSATVTQIDEVTDFLSSARELKPYPIKVLGPPQ